LHCSELRSRAVFRVIRAELNQPKSKKKKKKKEARCWASANASPIARAGPQAAVGQKVSRGLFKHSANFFIFLFYFSEAFNICFAQLLNSI
jgi:hypothetical protein